jgi:RHS repeat-associated protein
MTMPRSSSAFSRCVQALRRWFRENWLDRLSIIEWLRGCREWLFEFDGPSRSRKPTVQLEVGVLERREVPNDIFGLLGTPLAFTGLTLLNGNLLTPVGVLARGWAGGRGLGADLDTSPAVLTASTSRPADDEMAAPFSLFVPAASTVNPGVDTTPPTPAVNFANPANFGGPPLGTDPFRSPFDGAFLNAVGAALDTTRAGTAAPPSVSGVSGTPPGTGEAGSTTPPNSGLPPAPPYAYPGDSPTDPAFLATLGGTGAGSGSPGLFAAPATAGASATAAGPGVTASGSPATSTSRQRAFTNKAIREFPRGGGTAGPPGSAATFPATQPWGITSGPDGNLWYTIQGGTPQIGKMTTAGAAQEYTPTSQTIYPLYISPGPDRGLWFTAINYSTGQNTIGDLSLDGSTLAQYGVSGAGNPGGIVLSPDQKNLWYSGVGFSGGVGTSYVGKMAVDGTYTQIATPTNSSSMGGIVVGPDGNIWFTEPGANKIGKVNLSGSFTSSSFTEYTVPTSGASPYWIAADRNGALWFTESGTNKIGRITTAGLVTNEYSIPTANSAPHGITLGPDGSFWFTESATDQIGRITTAGTVTEYGGLTSGAMPESITVGSDRNLWFTEPGANQIGTFNMLQVQAQTLSVAEGQALTNQLVAWFQNPVGGTAATTYSATIDWGDGTTPSTVTPTADATGQRYTVKGSHTYAEEQATPYTVTITVTDSSGRIGAAKGQAKVTDALLQANPQVTTLADITVGTALTSVTLATFTDNDPSAASSDYTGTVDWGDGSPKDSAVFVQGTGSTFNVKGSHTYANASPTPYTIAARVVDHSSTTQPTARVKVKPLPGTLTDLSGGGNGAPGGDPTYDPTGGGAGITPDGLFLTAVGEASVAPNTGGLRLSTDLDFDLSPGTAVGGTPALVYNSDTVSVRPILPVTLTTTLVPTSIDMQLTWDGTPQGTYTYSTSGHSANDTYLLAAQVNSPASTGLHTYSLRVVGNGTSIDSSVSGVYQVVNNSSSPFGAGWYLDGLDRLIPVTAGATTGLLWVYGNGGSRLFTGTGPSYTSPADDFGTLVKNGDNSYTYTAKDQTQRRFDTSGRLTAVVDPHNLALTYSYDGSGRLINVASPDGVVTTLSYNANGLSGIQEPGGRSLTFGVNGSGDLTAVTDADGTSRAYQYDTGHRLTNDQWSLLNATFTYDTGTGGSGRLTSINRGLGTVYNLTPRQKQGLFVSSSTPAKTDASDVAVVTDPITYTLDPAGRLLGQQTADGATQTWARDSAGHVIAYTDGRSFTTDYSYDNTVSGKGDLLEVDYPDGGFWKYQYESQFHKVVRKDNAEGETTTYAYDTGTGRPGDLTGMTDAVGAPTTYVYFQDAAKKGLLSSVTDPLGLSVTYTYDNNRRQITATDLLSHTTTTAYDNAGNPSTVTDPLGHSTATGYDARDRLTLQAAGDGGQITYAYDAYGDRIGMTDQRGDKTTYAYDQRAFQTQVNEPEGRTTQYAYDNAGDATTITDPNGHTSTYTFDPVGRELTATVPLTATSNAVTTLAWDLAGNQTSVTDPLNHTTTFAYDPMNRLVAVIDPLTETTTTLYNTLGLVVARIDPDSNTTLYAYDGDNRLVAITDGVSATTVTAYDKDGNVTATVDPNLNTTTYVYDLGNRRTLTIDPLGFRTTSNYDAADRVTNVQDPLNHFTTFGYDNADRRTSITDALNHTTTTLYDLAGNTTKTVDGDGNPTTYAYDGLNRRTSNTNALSQTSTTKYDPNGNVTASTDPFPHTTSYAYDFANRLTTTTDPLGRLATNAYDAADRRTVATDFRGKTTTYAYDAANRTTTTTDPDNKVTTTQYDPAGNVIQVTDPAGDSSYTGYDGDNRVVAVKDFQGNTSRTVFDPAGNVLVQIDFRGEPTAYAYDGLNRQTRVTDPVGNPSFSIYDPAGRMTVSIDRRLLSTTIAYDNADRQTTITDPLGQLTTLAYDAANNRTAVTDPNTRTTTFSFDALNRQIAVTDPDNHTTTTAFDAAGRMTAVTDPDRHTTTYAYDAANRRTAVTDPRGATTTTLYDNQDNVTSVTDANNWTTTYQYDPDGLKTAAIDPQGNPATFAYDQDNRLSSTTDRLGRVRNFAYDKDGRETQEVWLSGGTAVNTLTYSYDGDGNLLSAANNVGTYTYSYDDDNRLASVQNPFGQILTYTYDGDGNSRVILDSFGGTTTSVYDRGNRLVFRQFSDSSAALSWGQGYTPRGELALVQRFKDAAGTQVAGATSYTYDPVAGLVKTIYHYSGGTVAQPFSGTVLASYVYSYDPANLLSTETINGGSPATYQYDQANEVTQDAYTNYTWDSAGNRTNAGFSQGTNKGDQLQTDGTWTYTYDAEGNEIQKSKGSSAETWVFTYDHMNHLLSAEDRPTPMGAASVHIDYKYDALGNRAERDVTINGVTTVTRYALDASGNAWADLSGTNALQVRRFYGDGVDQPVVRITYGGGAPAVAWYDADRQGSVRLLMDNTGVAIGQQSYDAFGNIHAVTGFALIADRYAYTGRERNEYTGFQYNTARWYDPATQRWLERDPIEFRAGQGNLYEYVGNDASNTTDPSGLSALSNYWDNWIVPEGEGVWERLKWVARQTNPGQAIPEAIGTARKVWNDSDGALAGVLQFLDDVSLTGQIKGQLKAAFPRNRLDVEDARRAAASNGTLVVDLLVGVAAPCLGLRLANPAPAALELSAEAPKPINTAEVPKAPEPAPGAAKALQEAKGPPTETPPPVEPGRPMGRELPDAGQGKQAPGPKSCFPAGTPVHTPAGLQAIEQIAVGDRVWAYDHKRLHWAERDVVEVYQLRHQRTMATIQVKGEMIRATGGHPFWVVRGEGLAQRPALGRIAAYEEGGRQEGRWVLAQDLRAGDVMLLRRGGMVPLESVAVDKVDETVYNFHVAELQNYAVGGFGVLVHNTNVDPPANGGNSGNGGEVPPDQGHQHPGGKPPRRTKLEDPGGKRDTKLDSEPNEPYHGERTPSLPYAKPGDPDLVGQLEGMGYVWDPVTGRWVDPKGIRPTLGPDGMMPYF